MVAATPSIFHFSEVCMEFRTTSAPGYTTEQRGLL